MVNIGADKLLSAIVILNNLYTPDFLSDLSKKTIPISYDSDAFQVIIFFVVVNISTEGFIAEKSFGSTSNPSVQSPINILFWTLASVPDILGTLSKNLDVSDSSTIEYAWSL